MEKITVRLPRFTQEIYVGDDALAEVVPAVKSLGYDNYFAVIDEGAYKADKQRFERIFSDLSIDAERIIRLVPKPQSKDFRTTGKILRKLTALRAARQTCVLAIGGGYVGDVTGFATAIFMRGIHFVQIPTTLMAQGDAIIGKVAINFEGKKNQLGAFYSPRLVFCDTSLLGDFSLDEQAYGLIEIWKHALLVKEATVIDYIEAVLTSKSSLGKYEELVKFSLETKAKFVEQDPEDFNGLHKALSLGHTIANVLEARLRFRHGLAVFYGLVYEALLAQHLGKLDGPQFSALMRTASCFENQFRKLPRVKSFLRKTNLIDALKGDKINSHGTYTFVIPTNDGYEVVRGLGADTIDHVENEFEAVKL